MSRVLAYLGAGGLIAAWWTLPHASTAGRIALTAVTLLFVALGEWMVDNP